MAKIAIKRCVTCLTYAAVAAAPLAAWHFEWPEPVSALIAVGAVALGCLLLRALAAADAPRAAGQPPAGPCRRRAAEKRGGPSGEQEKPARPTAAACRGPVDPHDTAGLVAQMLAQSRYTLLLRRQIAASLPEELFARTLEALREAMALVPSGHVILGAEEAAGAGEAPREKTRRETEPTGAPVLHTSGRLVRVEPFFLDRYPVTNRQFYEFVAAGGYEEMALWDPSVWPAVLDMVDQTGMPGPRFWKDGCYAPGEEDLPIVGVGWYEAAACARWLGKRLPTDAEWVKAACWPVAVAANMLLQRRYPWGDTMDRGRANLWGSGPNRLVAVREFAEGVSVGGVYQLIGNVWEWTGANFQGNPADGELVLSTPMKSIRGGAFDTYLDNQATGQFQSGENPLLRRHNIGFRCAIGACDLTLARPCPERAAPCFEQPAAVPEEALA
jgi:gamma-glutamyl hercynylcysteine S-oxide synthase